VVTDRDEEAEKAIPRVVKKASVIQPTPRGQEQSVSFKKNYKRV
jgi:hypothetical protein